ncbi:hypothetical protein CERSUDRAFT_69846 [Gelatoporia subvermispora B]|uniref:DUF6570 domain-containing protein n=1 Tax=Ceriporiopsis subvermispora (strain B) TaxID=914234 RepID=M2PWN8_CERS8|nr:hypothetical protein CERSUDRAFT_69846 [Gelatoporia subvermispora B]
MDDEDPSSKCVYITQSWTDNDNQLESANDPSWDIDANVDNEDADAHVAHEEASEVEEHLDAMNAVDEIGIKENIRVYEPDEESKSNDLEDYESSSESGDDDLEPVVPEASHLEQECKCLKVLHPSKRLVPVPIGPALPCRDVPVQSARYCRLMLMFFKPWRHAHNLRSAGESWANAFDHHTVDRDCKFDAVMNNMQIMHECNDSRQRHLRQGHQNRRFRSAGGLNDGAMVEADDLAWDEPMTEVLNYRLTATALECIDLADRHHIFTRVGPSGMAPEQHASEKSVDATDGLEDVWRDEYTSRKTAARQRMSLTAQTQAQSVTAPSTCVIMPDGLIWSVEQLLHATVMYLDSPAHSAGGADNVQWDSARAFRIIAEQAVQPHLHGDDAHLHALQMYMGGPGSMGKSTVINALLPLILAELTVLEQLLIAQVYPWVYVFKLFPKLRGYRPLEESLQRAMRGTLQQNNPRYYGDIIISDERLAMLPEDDVPIEVETIIEALRISPQTQAMFGQQEGDEEAGADEPGVVPLVVSGSVDMDLSRMTSSEIMHFITANIPAYLPGLEDPASLSAIPKDKEVAYNRPPDPASEDYENTLHDFELQVAQTEQIHSCCVGRCLKYDKGGLRSVLINARCNNDIKLLTNGEETRSVAFYVLAYAGKKHLKPEYKHEVREQQRLLLFHLVNTVNREQELAGPLVVSYLMGWGDSKRSHLYIPVYWSSFVGALCRQHPELHTLSRIHRDGVMRAAAMRPAELKQDTVKVQTEQLEVNRVEVLETADQEDILESFATEVTTKLQPNNYRFCGDALSNLNMFDFFKDTYEADMARDLRRVQQHKEVQEGSCRRGRPANERVPYLAEHPQHGKKMRIPWRDLRTDLKGENETWSAAFDAFLATCGDEIKFILSGIQYFYECSVAATLDRSEDDADQNAHVRQWVDPHGDGENDGDLGYDLLDDDELTEKGLKALKASQVLWREFLHGCHALETAKLVKVFNAECHHGWEIRSNHAFQASNGEDVARLLQWKAQMERDIVT